MSTTEITLSQKRLALLTAGKLAIETLDTLGICVDDPEKMGLLWRRLAEATYDWSDREVIEAFEGLGLHRR